MTTCPCPSATCFDERSLRQLVEARLPAVQRVRIWQHLGTCETCRAFVVAVIEGPSKDTARP